MITPSATTSKRSGIQTVSIIGAGVMGRGIAWANVQAGHRVRIFDSNVDTATAIVEEIQSEQRSSAISPPHFIKQKTPFEISLAKTEREIADADLVIETVTEKAAVKTELYERIEPWLAPETLLVTNTSSIPIEKLAVSLKNPQRFCGLHFCHPVAERPIVEIIGSTFTCLESLKRVVGYAESIGMAPIPVGDSPGFLLNRLLVPFMNEALELLLEQVPIKQLDQVVTRFGFPFGPLALLDHYGIDVALEVGRALFWKFPDRIVPSELLIAMYKSKRFGCKSETGFYLRQEGCENVIDPAVQQLICDRYRDANPITDREIEKRLFLPLLLEATRVLEEALVENPALIDKVLRDGVGMTSQFPGLFAWADAMGIRNILDSLSELQKLGKRFDPTQMLLDIAASPSQRLKDLKPAVIQ